MLELSNLGQERKGVGQEEEGRREQEGEKEYKQLVVLILLNHPPLYLPAHSLKESL